jgi:DNA-binding transcriptional ArsR family regulator
MSSAISEERLDRVFAALADPTRRRLLARLARGPVSVGELAAPLPMSLPAVSKHLRVLEKAGLLRREKDGRVHRCGLDARPLADASKFVERYRSMWEGSLDRLAAYLEGGRR